MNTIIVIILVAISHLVFAVNQNPGHLKPFGSVGSLINIDELDERFPNVLEFFTHYLPKSVPILSRQVLIHDKDYSLWQTDEKLEKNVHGLFDTNIRVDSFASKQRKKVQMTFGDFLDRYGKEALLYAQNVPTVLQKYLVVPKPFQCDVVIEHFQSAILLINGMNTSPLMIGEDHDRFHCVLRGRKRIVLVDTTKYPNVRKTILPDKRRQRGPPINPDKVDFDEYPAFSNIDYHIADLKSGDCLFIPSSWIFQERTLKNTIAVVFNIKHHQALDTDVNQLSNCANYDPTFTLDQIDWPTEPQTFGEVIVNLMNSKIKEFDQWQKAFSKHLSYDIAADPEIFSLFEEFFNSVDINSDGQVTSTEIGEIKGEHQHHITDILFEMAKMVHSRRKTSTSKSVDSDDDESNETSENNDESDKHSQNDKSDL